MPLAHLGTRILNPVRLTLPQAQATAHGWRGEIIHVDHFGNLASNIRAENLDGALTTSDKITVRLAGTTIQGMVKTFGERQPGNLVALLGSTGNLIVSVVNGSAAVRLKAAIGDTIEIEW
ncbi:MAG: hypothetical protein RBS68_12920 [Anaerolineales bacterium]|nr:hypothetical protein [Anaerolineales bacterium]